jgi:hypothetical protein
VRDTLFLQPLLQPDQKQIPRFARNDNFKTTDMAATANSRWKRSLVPYNDFHRYLLSNKNGAGQFRAVT